MFELNASRWVLTNRNDSAARPHVGPLVATVEVERHSEDAERKVVLEDLVVGVGDPKARVVAHEDDVAHREPDVRMLPPIVPG
jgi:hypothetical protein